MLAEAIDNAAQCAPRLFRGRRRLVSAPVALDAAHVCDVVAAAKASAAMTLSDCSYLHSYFLGDQPVRSKENPTRPEINNVVVENRAYQICKDRTDALVGAPVAYSPAGEAGGAHGDVSEGTDDAASHAVQLLNRLCSAAGKQACDLELVQWACECGVGYRLVLPSPELAGDEAPEAPFTVHALDPRSTFVVYSDDVRREPMYAVTTVTDEQRSTVDTVYTPSREFVIRDGRLASEAANPMGAVPIVEYELNSERMGVFEAVLSLLDAINTVESSRVDGVQQFVQSLLVLENVDIDSEEFEELKRTGCIKVSSTDGVKANIQLLTSELNQDQVQTLVDSMYRTVLSICGMPFNVGGSGSTSDTGAAVTMRDGWSNSESRCKETEAYFTRSERRFLSLALRVARTAYPELSDLAASAVEVKFTRSNHEAIQSKAQVLTTLLGSGRVHPRLAFAASDIWSDPERAYDLSEAYVAQQRALAPQPTATSGQPADGEEGTTGGVTAKGDGEATPGIKA